MMNGTWNLDILDLVFNAQDRNLVKRIPLTSTPRADIVSWAYTKDGVYSVKIAYMLGLSIPLQPHNACWDVVWRGDIPPKIRHFLWKFAANILLTRERLNYRHIANDSTCPFCFVHIDVTYNVLFECYYVQDM